MQETGSARVSALQCETAPFTGDNLEEVLGSFSLGSDPTREVAVEAAAQVGASTDAYATAVLFDELADWQTSENAVYTRYLQSVVYQAAGLAGHQVAMSALSAVASILTRASIFFLPGGTCTDPKDAVTTAVNFHVICECAAHVVHFLEPAEAATGVGMATQLLQHIHQLLEVHEAHAWALPCSRAALLAGVSSRTCRSLTEVPALLFFFSGVLP
jgi:hypothetical protein